MQIVKNYPNGVFNWVDLGTTDPDGAKSFYGALFGWSFLDVPTSSGMIYSMAQLEGYMVAGLGPMDPETQAQGVPPHWTSYVKHDDVDAVAARANGAGGVVIMPPFDIDESGRMAIIQDPTGAMFGVWQPGTHIGAQLVNIPNTLVWNELQTRDIDGAQAFYSVVFDWTFETDAGGYVVCKTDDRMQAGMMSMAESMADVPPNWSHYILVEDVKALVEETKKLGGNMIVPPTPAGDIGEFSVLQDPQGAVFSIIRYEEPASPPPGY
jgi:predicted enzyme related to lactoylglutathione lyase